MKDEGHISPLGQNVFHCPDQEFGCSHTKLSGNERDVKGASGVKMNQFRELPTGQTDHKVKILIKVLIKKTLVQSQSNLTRPLHPTCKNKDR